MANAKENFYNKLSNKEFRAKLTSNPNSYIKELVDEDLQDIEYKVVKSTKTTTYIAIPHNGEVINLSALGGVTAAATYGTYQWYNPITTGGCK